MEQAPEDNLPIEINDDPFVTFSRWFDEAGESEPNFPEAMSLATVDEQGLPNVRIVLMKGLDPAGSAQRGVVFYTNCESAKGGELAANPKAALLFYWKSLGRQVRIRGTISSVTGQEADAYFASRPGGSRIGAWASDQSRPLESRSILEKRIDQFTEKFKGSEVSRPPHWSGYRLTPLEIEFWKNGTFRLHHRLVYRRLETSARWTTSNLFP